MNYPNTNNRETTGSSAIAGWFTQRPKWLQVAAKRLLESGDLNDTDISELAELCQQEVADEFPDFDCNISSGVFNVEDSEEIRLCSISEVAGVNKLAPKKPLNFDNDNIVVIYGSNGSGKSGYVRLLKHVCGARDCIPGQLHGNVFSEEKVAQKAKISFRKNGISAHYQWADSGVCDDLCSVEIFDAPFGLVFTGDGGEVSYEPPILSFFSRLINVCDRVTSKLDASTLAFRSKMPSLPPSFLTSLGAIWANKLSANTSPDEVEAHCSFTAENETELQDLQRRISETSPADKAIQLKIKKRHADDLVKDFQTYLNKLSDKNCQKIIAANQNLIQKRSAAKAAAEDVFSDAKLGGIGSPVWKELWNAARKYSRELAYVGQEFPYVQDGSLCVLCHQSLSDGARQRFISLESYIKGETEKQAADATEEVKQLIDALPEIPSAETLETKINAAGIENQNIVQALNDSVNTLQDQKSKVQSLELEDSLDSFSQSPGWIEEIRKISQDYESNIKKYETDATKDNRVELQGKLKNLEARKWLSEQKAAIQGEINRLAALERINEAKRKANTRVLSTKKGTLSQELITDAFVQRFNDELRSLGASQIRVELIRLRVHKGKVIHTLQLNGADHDLNEVLSEGEKRIVSIAAFLADATGRRSPSSLVFDDPISSLDEDYEGAVVQRLCTIASERQVIIFTHRLSLLGMVQDYSKAVGVTPKIVCIREEFWGTGEPGDIPLFAKKPDKALNNLINDRLPKAKKCFEEKGREEYDNCAQALCSDFRILLERMIESKLLADVVQRYRRAIQTKGKIENLAKISESDCTYFDNMMTKYSQYLHSQPQEVPVSLPGPDELETDFNELKRWQSEFDNRSLSPAPLEAQRKFSTHRIGI